MTEPRSDQLPTLRDILASAHLRLILLAVALAAISLVISGTLVIRGYVQRNLELTAQTVNYTVEPAIVFNDVEAMGEGIASIAEHESISEIEILRPDGQSLAKWTKPNSGWEAAVEPAVNSFLWPAPAVSEVRRGEELLATILVYGSASAILSYALSGIIIALCCLGLTVIATRMLARRLQNDVIDPLDRVAEVAHSVRKKRAFSERVPDAGIAEIDRFTSDFNALLAELEGWHEGLTTENAELARRATRDELTGLGNRALFEQHLNESVADCLNGGKSLAVLYLDADDFKAINDRYGHEAGDTALMDVAHRLAESVRSADQAYRLGGDEFALLVHPLGHESHLFLIEQRLKEAMLKPCILPDGNAIRLSMSIGAAVFPDDGNSPQSLLRHADAAMYRGKRDRNRARIEEVKHA